MTKSPLLSATVLILGLASCAPDKKTNDVYHATPPFVHTNDTEVSLRDWDLQKSRQYDLQDIIDFKDSHPKKIDVKTECRTEDDRILAKFNFVNESEVAIWRMLPNEVLTANFNRSTYDCAFELNLFDEAGSNHVFNISPVEVLDEKAAPAQIAHEATFNPKGLLKLSPQTEQDVRLRFPTTAPSSAQLICQGTQLPPLGFDQVLDLAHFQFPTNDILAAHPVQLCRALITQSGKRVAYSNLIQFAWAPPQVTVTDETTPFPQLTPTNFDKMLIALRTAAPLKVARWRVHNSEKITRYFRFNLARTSLTLSLFARAQATPFIRMTYNLPLVQAYPQANVIKTAWSTVTAVLPPFSDLIVEANIQSQTPMHCQVQPEFHFITLENFAPIPVTEVGKDGSALSTFDLQAKAQSIAAEVPVNLAAAPEGYHCDWY